MIKQNIIFFDGVCNFCNGAVNFIIKRDINNKFLFSSLQSDNAKKILSQYHKNNTDLNTLILIKNDTLFEKSDAVIEITKEFSGLWFLVSYFKILPQSLRDFIYSFIAKNRYKLFGKKESCMIPTKEQKKRFLL